nr:conotoxin precursor T [Conus judaeus]
MRCLLVFVILLQLTASAPGVDGRPKTEDDVSLSSVSDNAKITLQTLWDKRCCPPEIWCCGFQHERK